MQNSAILNDEAQYALKLYGSGLLKDRVTRVTGTAGARIAAVQI